MEPENPAVRPPRRLGTATRLVLGAAVLGLVVLGGLGVLILPHIGDEPPFDDSDLIEDAPPVPREEDAALAIRRALGKLDGVRLSDHAISGGTRLDVALARAGWEIFRPDDDAGGHAADASGDRPDAAAWETSPLREPVERALAGDAAFFESIETACRLPRCSGPVSGWSASDEWLGPHVEARESLALRAEEALLRGDFANAAATDILLLRYSARRLDGTRSVLGFLTALTDLRLALSIVARHHRAGVFAGREDELVSELAALRLDRTAVSRTIRAEYREQRRMILELEEFVAEENPGLIADWVIHPNETLRVLGEYYRAAIAEGEATGRVVTVRRPEVTQGTFGRIRGGNPYGKMLLAGTADAASLYARAEQTIGELEELRTAIGAASGR